MILQIATALAIGAYVVLSKDARPKRPNSTSRESFQPRPIISISTVAMSSRRFMTTFSSARMRVRGSRSELRLNWS